MVDGVQFDVDTEKPVHSRRESLGLAGLLIKHSHGKISNENQANSILLLFVVLAIVVSLFIIFGSNTTVGHPSDIKILPA